MNSATIASRGSGGTVTGHAIAANSFASATVSGSSVGGVMSTV